MRIAMIETSYVGPVSGACLADLGHQVTCLDKHTGKIEVLQRGEILIYEPGPTSLSRATTLQDGSISAAISIRDGACRPGGFCGRHGIATRRTAELTNLHFHPDR